VRKTIVAAITRPGHGGGPIVPAHHLANPDWVTALTPSWPTSASSASRWTHPTRHVRSWPNWRATCARPSRSSRLAIVPGVTPELVGELFAAAAEFHRAAPWVKLVNAQALAIRLFTEVEPSYVSVMGNAGIEYGLSISRTWADFQAMASGSGDGPMTRSPQVACTLCVQLDHRDSFDDLEALEKYHWQVAHADACPMRSFLNPGSSLAPQSGQLLWYQAVLRAFLFLCATICARMGRGLRSR